MKTALKNTVSYHTKLKTMLCMVLLFIFQFPLLAEETAVKVKSSAFSNPVFIGLLMTVIVLLIAIIILANIAKTAVHYRMEEQGKEENGDKSNFSGFTKTFFTLLVIFFGSGTLLAQAETAQALTEVSEAIVPAFNYWGMGVTLFYSMIFIIAFELFVVWFLYGIAMMFLGARERKESLAAEKAKKIVKKISLLEKLNDSVAIEKEADIMLDHNYDGIRELDNNLPPWWKYGFYLTILISIIYLFHYHVSHTGKLQVAEYEAELKQAAHEIEEYRKSAANLVDENNVVMLTDAASLSSGKSIFSTNCAACHGANGEGGVGPNLTDDYWMHMGDVKSIFKSIKFGWPEMGMKSWEQDLGAKQISEVTSYIMSLSGTKPANAKEPQGELYKETSDSLTVDSLTVKK